MIGKELCDFYSRSCTSMLKEACWWLVLVPVFPHPEWKTNLRDESWHESRQELSSHPACPCSGHNASVTCLRNGAAGCSGGTQRRPRRVADVFCTNAREFLLDLGLLGLHLFRCSLWGCWELGSSGALFISHSILIHWFCLLRNHAGWRLRLCPYVKIRFACECLPFCAMPCLPWIE